MTRVVVFGASGMLGSMVTSVLGADESLDVVGTVRKSAAQQLAASVKLETIDAETATENRLMETLAGAQWAVNAIGVIKPYIRDDNAEQVERAMRVNAIFPHTLGRAAARTGTRVLQIATDCVYSGARGSYLENDPHDALDVYGKSKSLGEAHLSQIHHLRCSIVGPELGTSMSLLEWFLSRPRGAVLQGYVHHRWNGVTTLQFGRICRGLIRDGAALPLVQHVVPADIVTKKELLEALAAAFDRRDITIDAASPGPSVDRTLATTDPSRNSAIWRAAGYQRPPAIAEMIHELAQRLEARGLAR